MPITTHDRLLISAISAAALSVAMTPLAQAAQPSPSGSIVVAQANPDDAKRKEEERRKRQPERKGPSGGSAQPGANNVPPDRKGPPGGPSTRSREAVPPDKGPPAWEKKAPTARPNPYGGPPPGSPPPAAKSYPGAPSQPGYATPPPSGPPGNKNAYPGGPPPSDSSQPRVPRKASPNVPPGGPPPATGMTPKGPSGPQGPALGVNPPPKGIGQGRRPDGAPSGTPAPSAFRTPGGGPPRFDDVQKGRRERVEGSNRVIEEPGNRVIVKQGNRAVIRHDETERFRHGGRDVKTARTREGHTETFYVRPDGMRIVSVTDGNGRLLRRYRRGPDGREYNIIDNRRFMRNVAIGVGIGAAGLAILALAPPRVSIAREKYIVDYERASDDDLYEAFDAPPVERLERAYSLEEIRDNYELRQRMRYVELSNLNFESGAWEITPDQYPKLERLARAINRVLRRNPDEVFLIEGHTDAVGSDVDNLSLSDRRASSVAEVLSESFGVPPENLVTQGYGEQHLKVPTPGPEPLNRRVEVRRIGPLMSAEQQ